MNYQRTQVYLDPADHAALKREAQQRGISLAELMRELTARHVREGSVTYQTKTIDALIGLVDEGEPADVIRDWDRTMDEVAAEIYQREMPRRKRSAT